MAKKKPTGHIFSEKTRKRNAQIETAEYFEKHVLPKIMDHTDIRELSNPEIRGMKKYLRQRQQQIKRVIQEASMLQSETFTFESTTRAKEEHIDTKTFSNRPEKLLRDFMRQEEFFNEYETDEDYYTHRQEFRQFEDSMSQETAESLAQKLNIDPNDKWTILRRLAAIDNRLNIDRAYASDTLKQIEDLIEQNSYRDIDELTSDLMEEVIATGTANQEWNKSLQPLTSEDLRLVANKGFHGREKAKTAYSAWNRFIKEHMSPDIHNYEPIWSEPTGNVPF